MTLFGAFKVGIIIGLVMVLVYAIGQISMFYNKYKARKLINKLNNTGKLDEIEMQQAKEVRNILREHYYSQKDKELQELYDELNLILTK